MDKYQTIEINNQVYYLVPVEKPESPLSGYRSEATPELVGDVSGVAQPKVSDYRERYKRREIYPDEIKAEKKPIKLVRQDHGMDQFGDLVFGPGIEEEW